MSDDAKKWEAAIGPRDDEDLDGPHGIWLGDGEDNQVFVPEDKIAEAVGVLAQHAPPESATTYQELDGHDLRRVQTVLPRAVLEELKLFPTLRVAGGFIRSVVAGEVVQDVDLFPGDVARAEEIAKSIASRFAEPPGAPLVRVVKTLHAFTVHFDPVVQVVHRWPAATPEDLLRGFDFTIGAACVWWDATTNLLRSLVHPRFYRDVAAKRLTFIAPADGDEAGGSILRVQKFARRGYRASAFQVARIIGAIAKEAGKKLRDDEPLERSIARLIREVDPSTQDGWEELISDGTGA